MLESALTGSRPAGFRDSRALVETTTIKEIALGLAAAAQHQDISGQPEQKLGPTRMHASVGSRSLRMVLLLAASYLLIGIAFGAFSDWAATDAMHLLWRRSAWLVSGVGFAAHIAYEHFRLGSRPRTTAMHVSTGAALGAGGLAVAANFHEWISAPHFRPSMAI